MDHRIFDMPLGEVYPHYVTKVERKGRTVEELDEVLRWLTGFDQQTLHEHIDRGTSFRDVFAAASIAPGASAITGSICGVKVQEIEDPLMQQIRWMDKIVDELAKGRAIEKIIRS